MNDRAEEKINIFDTNLRKKARKLTNEAKIVASYMY